MLGFPLKLLQDVVTRGYCAVYSGLVFVFVLVAAFLKKIFFFFLAFKRGHVHVSEFLTEHTIHLISNS